MKRNLNLIYLDSVTEEWLNGVRLGSAQNFARDLMECPANHLTPTLFVAEVIQQMKGLPVNIEARYKSLGNIVLKYPPP